MSDELEYRPLPVREVPGEDPSAKRTKLDLRSLKAVGTVALCDIDDAPTANVRPHISMSIIQCVRLSDGSLVRLDMDRGVTTVWFGAAGDGAISWKSPLNEVLNEVLNLVRADDPHDPTRHPWEELAEAARVRGVEVDAETLAALPYRVVFTAEAIAAFVG